MHKLGTHLHLELWECPAAGLNDLANIREALLLAARHAKCEVMNEAFHRFSPQGVSGILLLAESHLSVHTWPELGYAALDVFTCGDEAKPHLAAEFLVEFLHAGRYTVATFDRGIPATLHERKRAAG